MNITVTTPFSNLTIEQLLSMHNLTEDDIEATNEAACDEGITQAQMEAYLTLSWWLEGVIQIVLGVLGFVANSVAIPILLSREMSSIFNRLLTCMAVLDNVFIVCSVMESVRKHIVSTLWQNYLFGYFLYQFHSMVLCACIYVTVVLALERYRAVWRPVEYHNIVNGSNPWSRVAGYIVPVIAFSVGFNIPKFFEARFVDIVVGTEWFVDPDTGEEFKVNITRPRLSPTSLKLSNQYVLWYSNVARLFVTGILPFMALAYLNSRIYKVIRRRRRMTNRPRGAPSAAQKAEESRQAIVLLVIVVLFVFCHTLRIILNIHGLFSLKIVRESLSRGCSGITQYWTLIGTVISHILLTINSSVNFFIYCFMSTTFRKILYRWINQFCGCKCPEVIVQNEASTAAGHQGHGGDHDSPRHLDESPDRTQLHLHSKRPSAVTAENVAEANGRLVNGHRSKNSGKSAAAAAAAEEEPLINHNVQQQQSQRTPLQEQARDTFQETDL